jgi:hypothetical protein
VGETNGSKPSKTRTSASASQKVSLLTGLFLGCRGSR